MYHALGYFIVLGDSCTCFGIYVSTYNHIWLHWDIYQSFLGCMTVNWGLVMQTWMVTWLPHHHQRSTSTLMYTWNHYNYCILYITCMKQVPCLMFFFTPERDIVVFYNFPNLLEGGIWLPIHWTQHDVLLALSTWEVMLGLYDLVHTFNYYFSPPFLECFTLLTLSPFC